ncbi:MAG: hypothetical protein LBJ46_04585 [Planctomycetota bacterium]|nr:hypothetical protein [Planctomycetota bacterium]
MAEQWRIGRGSRTCAATGEGIAPGETFYSALVERGDDFERRDYAAAAWPDVDKTGFFSYWKNKPRSGKDGPAKRKIDYDRLLAFYDDLAPVTEPRRLLFRYVLALILARRRILRLDATRRTPEGEVLVLYDKRTRETTELCAPEATAEELRETETALANLFDYDADSAGNAPPPA